ncbi:MAG: ribonucleoside-diphosphate reductase subunit alpha [Simkaniaceae bacterium]|nr:ribonucleoside-diphosphate reductase subunit alpha [Simkaniaceae bacterium]
MTKLPSTKNNKVENAENLLEAVKTIKPFENTTKITLVKRNGTTAPFRKERIFNAIEAAFRDTKSLSKKEPLEPGLISIIQKITDLVTKQAIELAEKSVMITVEGIQDLVEVTLMKNGHHDVARDYIIYRDKHKTLRSDSPENLKVFRSDTNSPVRFNPMKIASTLEHSFRRFYQINDRTPENFIEDIHFLTQKIVSDVMQFASSKQALNITDIQNILEERLMKEGQFRLAKELILYRSIKEKKASLPTETLATSQETKGKQFTYLAEDGTSKTVTESEIIALFQYACNGLENVSANELYESSIMNFYDSIKESEVNLSHIMAAKAKIEVDPAYSKVATRLLLNQLYQEAMGIDAQNALLEKTHRSYFKSYITDAITRKQIAPELAEFDLDKLAESMDLHRDDQFAYLGLQTLYDRYFIHHDDRRLETPQIFWMRVAMGLAINEENKNARAIEFYNVLSAFYFVPGTPTLFNSGTTHSQLSSCYLSTIMDDLSHIFKTISDDAQLSKWAGGIGNDWTNVRATGAKIKGTNGRSQGVIPFLKVANDTAVAVNQGGKRKGAMCAYLETWHIDIEDFLELRKNSGDERRRTHDMNTANWIPDLFMKRVLEDKEWTLFSPNDTPDLHDLYGKAFEKRYEEYEKLATQGKIKLFKKIEALSLWRKMLGMLFETGHPWITFKDPANIRSPQDHVGVIHSSNLCTEIFLNTSKEETAVCNLGSINLVKHTTKNGLDKKQMQKTIKTAIRMLDNVIDINFYPIAEAKHSNIKHRPVGLGLMGFQDALYIQNISYASHEAVKFADESTELIAYHAILSSSELAKERSPYSTYKGSKWDRGYLPLDTLSELEKERGRLIDVDRSSALDWDIVRKSIKKNGMRNSNTMAIAPTATIANIIGVTSSIEPTYKNLYAKSNLSGEFTIANTYLVDELKRQNLWDAQMLDDLKYFDGSIQEIDRVPEHLKKIYLTAFEIDAEWIIECASRRQKWIDMGQSLNLYFDQVDGKKLHQMYILMWEKGGKSTYYLRSRAATQVEKSTTDINKRGMQPKWMKNASPSSRIEIDRKSKAEELKAPVCNLEEGCESCQ